MKRQATAVWKGTGKDGKGHLTTQSAALNKTQCSFSSRFEEGVGTNPEELIAAAHAGCFTMKLAFNLQAASFTPDELTTNCKITLENGAITTSELSLKATIAAISEEQFAELVKDAEASCPVSKVLNATISVDYILNQ
jgi:osmotically inducible protein OsmC